MPLQLYPFSKNRYFPRKRMRSVDFIREQEYIDRKLSFLNHWTLGTGVAVGLGVQRLDSDSLLVSPGFAVDALGRCLIVDEPSICRIRTLDGFNTLSGETAVLWLSYREEMTDPMFVPGGEEETQEYAAVRERYAFSLTGKERLPSVAADQALFSNTVLYDDDELRIRQVIPKVLSRRRAVELQLVIESYYPEPIEIELHYAPVLPGFTAAQPGQEARLDQRLQVGCGRTVLSLPVRLTTAAQAASISLPETGFLLEKRGTQLRAQCEFQEEFHVVPDDPVPALRERLFAHTPQELRDDGGADGIPIAVVRLVRYHDNCLLDDVFPLPDLPQAELPCLQERLRRCESFFKVPDEPESTEQLAAPPDQRALPLSELAAERMTTGVVTLNTGLHQKEGSILRSEEIAHGLGPGTVFIEFGIENIYPAVNSDRNCADLLLGDVSLFTQASGSYDANLDRGVRIHPEKGTFELAVRLKGSLRQSSLRLRWYAWRPDEDVPSREFTGGLLRLEPDIIYAAPGAVIHFVPVFSDNVTAPCDFWVPDKQAGLITRDGVYTAPEKDGLYQVCAQIQDMPSSKVFSFVIVRTGEGEDAAGTV